jgi:hypothetical protein
MLIVITMRTSNFTFFLWIVFRTIFWIEKILVYNHAWELLWISYKFCGNNSEPYSEAYKSLTVHFSLCVYIQRLTYKDLLYWLIDWWVYWFSGSPKSVCTGLNLRTCMCECMCTLTHMCWGNLTFKKKEPLTSVFTWRAEGTLCRHV